VLCPATRDHTRGGEAGHVGAAVDDDVVEREREGESEWGLGGWEEAGWAGARWER
jgi:hypothetical protein